MSAIKQHLESRCKAKTDINEHLKTLYEHAQQCGHITEFGFRSGESTCAFLAAAPKKLVTYDMNPECAKTHEKLMAMCPESTQFEFICDDTRKVRIEQTDLLFIDTRHTYGQLAAELKNGHRVKKFIILHDTETFGSTGEGGEKGLSLAIIEFLKKTKKWQVAAHYSNNNGLTILERR